MSIYLQLGLPIHNDLLFLLLGIFNYAILINMQLHSFQMPMRQVNLSQTKPLMISNGISDQSMSLSASNSSANSAVIISIVPLFHCDVFPLWQSRWRSSSDGPGPSLEMNSFTSWLVTDTCSPKSISSSYFKVFIKNAHNFSCQIISICLVQGGQLTDQQIGAYLSGSNTPLFTFHSSFHYCSTLTHSWLSWYIWYSSKFTD